MSRASRHAALVCAALACFVPMRAGAAGTENAHTLTIDNFTFAPSALTIAPGTTVTWINRDDIPHTVTSTTKLFRSPALDTGQSFSFTFSQNGRYTYFCSLHPHMTGTIVVEGRAGQ